MREEIEYPIVHKNRTFILKLLDDEGQISYYLTEKKECDYTLTV